MPSHVRHRLLLTAVAGLGGLVFFTVAQAAGGAPAPPTEQPSFSGYPGYGSQLTCKQGSWGSDAESFAYSWHLEFDGSELARGQRYRPNTRALNQRIFCRVTAEDAGGAPTTADSAAVVIARGRTTIKLKAKSPQHGGTVRLTGKVGPPASIKPMSKGRNRGSVVAYRQEGDTLFQLFGKYKLDNKGRFSITAPDKPGKNRYKVNFNPNEFSLWEPASAFKRVNLKKR